MIYVTSDIHGEYEKFLSMLKQIEFSKRDTLYILGDILDRGCKPLDVLDYIKDKENIFFIKGNHEQMFCDFYLYDDYLWITHNGGASTYKQILERESIYGTEYQKGLYEYIKKLPTIMVIEVNGKNYILSHGGLFFPHNCNNLSLQEFLESQSNDILLWGCKNYLYTNKYKDYINIQGHYTIKAIKKNLNDYYNINANMDIHKIFHKGNSIYIDCGSGYKDGVLSCLRLDDMKEFYVQ